MGCSNCASGNGVPSGCKSNGACGTYGCNKLDVFDWMSGMDLPSTTRAFDVVEVRFKHTRKGFYRVSQGTEVYTGDVVVVDVGPGYDVGVVSLTGELVKNQMKRRDVKDNYEIKKILRKATDQDIAKWQEARGLEQKTMMRSRELAKNLRLDMKISDVEYQGDKSKATFFYTADDRVDFRELIKRFAEEFKIRVDMRQIGYRLEAARVGGIGSCGRELCCSSWLSDFRAVSTSAARYQQLSINPSKLAGQCGKLKCCLNYELDQYVEALRDIPPVNTKLILPKGNAFHFKTDIFQRIMYFVYEHHDPDGPFPLSVEMVKEIIEKNRKGVPIESIESYASNDVKSNETDFAVVVGQDSLTRFDNKRSSRNKSRQRTRDNGNNKGNAQRALSNENKSSNSSGSHGGEQNSARSKDNNSSLRSRDNRRGDNKNRRPNQRRDGQEKKTE
ncbi:MAG: regulatory iron-sulfur-containing complex subunit RicT [Flavobacteriales bacterium]